MQALTDLAVATHLIAEDENGLGTSVRRQLGTFYFFAGFWKFNSSFLSALMFLPMWLCSRELSGARAARSPQSS